MSERRRWDLYVRDMLQACERVTAYTAGMDQSAFLGDTRTYDAALRNLELIGEAATHIPNSVREVHAVARHHWSKEPHHSRQPRD